VRIVAIAIIVLTLLLQGCGPKYAARTSGMGNYLKEHADEATKVTLIEYFGSPSSCEVLDEGGQTLVYTFSSLGSSHCSRYVIDLDERLAVRSWEKTPCGPLEPLTGDDPFAPVPFELSSDR